MEKVKRVAVYQCLKYSNVTIQTLYNEVVSVTHHARNLYDNGAMEGIIDFGNSFTMMMLHDACFLVQYMRFKVGSDMDHPLSSFFRSKDSEIFHDILLLGNQLPWLVIQGITRFVPVPLAQVIDLLRCCLYDVAITKPLELDASYCPPHLLGLLRFHMVRTKLPTSTHTASGSLDISINKLAEIGIKLAANKTNDLLDMGLEKKWPFFAELYLAPLSLKAGPSCLINMAAHELCVTSFFPDPDEEDGASAVCSYLLFLAVLVRRKEDVHELRTKQILKGVGFTDKQVLDLFSKLHDLSLGSNYVRTIGQIEEYMVKRRKRIKVYAFFYRNWKTIATAFSVIAAIAGILKLLQPLVIKGP